MRHANNPGGYFAFARRILKAAGRRAESDVDLLPNLVALSTLVDRLVASAVASAHAEGYSWSEIADRLGTTRQAAHKRFGKREIA